MRSFSELEAELNYHFSDPRLLQRALTHSSHAHEANTSEDNEQLEFLGDAILGFLVSDMLFRAHPLFTEGQLSKLKSFFVSGANLVKYAEQLSLGEYLHLGRGEEKTGGRGKQALLVDAFEAIIGAVYVDGGIEVTRRLVERFFERQIAGTGSAAGQLTDFKTALQEELQSRGKEPARYTLVGEAGPDHQKLFTIDVQCGDRTLARGMGLTKKAAEQAAAKQALETLKPEEQEYWKHDGRHVQEIDSSRVL